MAISKKATPKKGGYVQISFLEADTKEHLELHYCEEVLRSINVLLEKDHPYSDIAILVRDNKHGVLLADYLTSKDVPVISPDSLLINTNSKVRFLVDLLQYSVDEENLELSFDILYFLTGDNENKHALVQRHYKNLKAFLMEAYGFDLSVFKQQSVFDGMEQAIKKFNLCDGSVAHLTFFMDVVFEVEQKEGAGIYTFLSYWEKKKDKQSIAAPNDMNAIQIMSIHKSKGLEFPIVIFPFANSHIYKEIDPKIWLTVDPKEFCGFKEVLITKKKEIVSYNDQAAEAFENEQHKLELDAFNILYVALTRAEKALFIISEKSNAKNGQQRPTHYSNLFIHYLNENNLWNDTDLIYTFGSLETNKADSGKGTKKRTIPFLYSHKDSPNFTLMSKSGGLWGTDKEEALKKGDLIHYIMSQIESEIDVEPVFERARQQGMINVDEFPTIKAMVYGLIQNSALGTYYAKGRVIKNEKDIITSNGNILRPDRVVIDGNSATIIDYKTGKENDQYRDQLNSYAKALEDMGIKVEHKIVVYINKEISIQYI